MLKLSQVNKIIDLQDLNRFRIGDEVIVDASADNDRFEGLIIGIELTRRYSFGSLEPSITLLHDGYVTDGFKPIDCRKVDPTPPAPKAVTAGQGVEAESLQAKLAAIRKSVRNAMGAIESNQVADKDVRGTLNDVLKHLDALVGAKERTQ